MCKRVLDLQKASYLSFGQIVMKSITVITFGVDNVNYVQKICNVQPEEIC